MSQEPTIRRGIRNARYAAIPNHVFEDSRLSMEARWLLSYLLSKPDNWTVVLRDITNKGGCGRDKARKMIAELVEYGYAEREQQRDDGKFGSSVLVIFDEPRNTPETTAPGESVAFLPQTEMPAPAMPSPVSPAPVKSAHSNNLDSANTDCQNLREGASEAEYRKIEEAFWRVVKGWPDSVGMPKDAWKREWFALSPEDRADAARLRDEWLALLKKKRDHIPVPGTYFREKLWRDLPSPADAAKSSNSMAAPYGKLWNATRIAALLTAPTGAVANPTAFDRAQIAAGKTTMAEVIAEKRMRSGWPTVNIMHDRARERQGWICPVALEEAAHEFHQVHRDSDLMLAWKREHQRRGWPFYDNKSPEWVYFPAISAEPDDLDHAVADAVERYRKTISDYLASRSKGDDHAA